MSHYKDTFESFLQLNLYSEGHLKSSMNALRKSHPEWII